MSSLFGWGYHLYRWGIQSRSKWWARPFEHRSVKSSSIYNTFSSNIQIMINLSYILVFLHSYKHRAWVFSAYLFNRRTGWERLQNMTIARHGVMCGLVTDNRGNRKVIISGGYGAHNLAAVESFDLQTMRWNRETNDFPFTPVGYT